MPFDGGEGGEMADFVFVQQEFADRLGSVVLAVAESIFLNVRIV